MIEQYLNEIASAEALRLPEMELPEIEEERPSVRVASEELHHRLTNYVRSQYLGFTKRILKENYLSWADSDVGASSGLKVDDEDIHKCALEIEMDAVRACMVVSLYRKAILTSIENIQKETNDSHLNTTLINTRLNKKRPATKEASTQTSERESRKRKSLESKIQEFERSLSEKRKPEQFMYQLPMFSPPMSTPLRPPATPHPRVPLPEPTPFLTPASTCTNASNNDALDDKIMQELQELFGEDEEQAPKDSLEEDIFGDHLPELQLESQPQSPELHPFERRTDPETQQRRETEKLKLSLWPCELHYQRSRLRSVLSEIAETNYRHYEKIRGKFLELFDDDSDENVLAPYSPTIELDEVLVSSCRRRIANWVVRALMGPMKDGLIGNRCLFKKLAKRIAEGIIVLDQYPDERFVKDYVEDFFCSHPRILSLQDIY